MGRTLAGKRDDMPQHTRAVTRDARDRARATGETYTQAREAVLAIRKRMVAAGETFDDAQAWYDDPAHRLLCATCGWTVSMICPECPSGCGCSTDCDGWRHADYSDADPAEDDECECGASNEYDCVCF